MRKILSFILVLLCFTGTTLAYTPSEKDNITIDAVTKKVEAIINKGTSRAKFIHALESFREKQTKNEKIYYLVNAVIERLQSIENTYLVTSVIDGDTIKVTRGNEEKTVRIIGIDTPEKYPTRTGYEECYGKEASDFATNTLSGKVVTIEADSTQNTIDKYGRLLGHVFLSGSIYYESLAIQEGYGFHYVYEATPSKYDKQLKLAEDEAKKNIVGVWNYCEGKRKPIEKSGSGMITGTGIQNIPTIPSIITNPLKSNSFSCSVKKIYCTEMNSCEEAKYYINFCGVIQLDRNEDGIPCESLCK